MDPLNDALNAALTVSSGQLAFLTLSQMPDNRAQMPSHGPRWVAEPPFLYNHAALEWGVSWLAEWS